MPLPFLLHHPYYAFLVSYYLSFQPLFSPFVFISIPLSFFLSCSSSLSLTLINRVCRLSLSLCFLLHKARNSDEPLLMDSLSSACVCVWDRQFLWVVYMTLCTSGFITNIVKKTGFMCLFDWSFVCGFKVTGRQQACVQKQPSNHDDLSHL